eukprot:660065-Pyramimonas_sp.AAC.1
MVVIEGLGEKHLHANHDGHQCEHLKHPLQHRRANWTRLRPRLRRQLRRHPHDALLGGNIASTAQSVQ